MSIIPNVPTISTVPTVSTISCNNQMYINGDIGVTGDIDNPFIDFLYSVTEILVEKNIVTSYEILQKQIEYKNRGENKYDYLMQLLHAKLSTSDTILLGLEREGEK